MGFLLSLLEKHETYAFFNLLLKLVFRQLVGWRVWKRYFSVLTFAKTELSIGGMKMYHVGL